MKGPRPQCACQAPKHEQSKASGVFASLPNKTRTDPVMTQKPYKSNDMNETADLRIAAPTTQAKNSLSQDRNSLSYTPFLSIHPCLVTKKLVAGMPIFEHRATCTLRETCSLATISPWSGKEDEYAQVAHEGSSTRHSRAHTEESTKVSENTSWLPILQEFPRSDSSDGAISRLPRRPIRGLSAKDVTTLLETSASPDLRPQHLLAERLDAPERGHLEKVSNDSQDGALESSVQKKYVFSTKATPFDDRFWTKPEF